MAFHSFATQVATLQEHNAYIFMKGKYFATLTTVQSLTA